MSHLQQSLVFTDTYWCLATCLGLTRITIALQNSNPAIIMDVNSPFLCINHALWPQAWLWPKFLPLSQPSPNVNS